MEYFKGFINFITKPEILITASMIIFTALLFTRKIWTAFWAKILFALGALFMLVSMTDPNFRLIVIKPDNVPIVGMLFLVGFFVWYGMYKAKSNDDRMAQGLPPKEVEDNEKVLVWPNLVYTELICLIIFSIVLTVWGIGLKAPLEQPANPAESPNPSKAPWYFLVNPKGSGYYTFKERKWEITVFLFGFVILWVLLIVLGTFLRGPNWNFFGPYEYWDVHKVLVLNNINLSEYFWVMLLKQGLPSQWWLREIVGFVIVGIYLFVLPVAMAKTVFKRFYDRMGPARFYIGALLFLAMVALPLKMYLRWLFNLKYIIAIPEAFFNI
jgi:hypothetical protein